MSDYLRNNVDSLYRVDSFGDAYNNDFKETDAVEDFAAIKSGLTELEQQGVSRSSFTNAGKTQTARKSVMAVELEKKARRVAKTAGVIAKKYTDFENTFIIPRYNLTYEKLLELVRQFARDAAAHKVKFAARGLKAEFFDDLNEDIEDFEAALDAQTDNKRGAVGSSAEINRILKDLLEHKADIHETAQNIYDNDPQKFAEWMTAYHVERPAEKKKDEPPTA